MAFYDLSKEERAILVNKIKDNLSQDINLGSTSFIDKYFSDEDTYIRKSAYLSIGRIYKTEEKQRATIIKLLENASKDSDEKVRQTAVNAAGAIGIIDFNTVQSFFDVALFDEHHIVRNAVIGSLKKMAQKNPKSTLDWAKQYLLHEDKEVRREVCHGIELRGRTHPEDVLPLLALLQFEKTARVRNTLIHVLGQISYKKNCLSKVITAFNTWKDTELVASAIEEIIDVHSEKRYAKFTALSQQEVINYIDDNLKLKENQ